MAEIADAIVQASHPWVQALAPAACFSRSVAGACMNVPSDSLRSTCFLACPPNVCFSSVLTRHLLLRSLPGRRWKAASAL